MKKIFTLVFLLFSFNLFSQNANLSVSVIETSYDDQDPLYNIFTDGDYTFKCETTFFYDIKSDEEISVKVYKKDNLIKEITCYGQSYYLIPEVNKFFYLTYDGDNICTLEGYDYKKDETHDLYYNDCEIQVAGRKFFLTDDGSKLIFLQIIPTLQKNYYSLSYYNVKKDEVEIKYFIDENVLDNFITLGKLYDDVFCFIYDYPYIDDYKLKFFEIKKNALVLSDEVFFTNLIKEKFDTEADVDYFYPQGFDTMIFEYNRLNAKCLVLSWGKDELVDLSSKVTGTASMIVRKDNETYLVINSFCDDYGIIRVYDKYFNLIFEEENEYGGMDFDYHIDKIGFNSDGVLVVEYQINGRGEW